MTGLADILSEPGPLTVFAPTNEAFAKLPSSTVDNLLKPENSATLREILLYQVVRGRISTGDLRRGIKAGGGHFELTTLEGGKLTASLSGSRIILTDELLRTATVSGDEAYQSNGVIQSIDTVMSPRADAALKREEAAYAQMQEAERSTEMAYHPDQQFSIRPATPEPKPEPPARQPAAHHPARQPASIEAGEYEEGNELQAWINSLKNGLIEYRVPQAMTVQQPSTVTVVIHGFGDTQSRTLADSTGSGSLKVSARMKVELFAPLNPGEFNLVPQSQPIQFIPNYGYDTWMWNVTPLSQAARQQLQIRVSLERQQGKQEQIVVEKIYSVDVNVQSLPKVISDQFWKNPVAWFQYMLPGGKGWGALAALVASLGGVGGIVGFMKRKKRRPAAGTRAHGLGAD